MALAALPLFAFLLGHFVAHAFESRYVIGSILGIAALVAIALDPVLENRVAVVVGLAVLAAVYYMCGGCRRFEGCG